MMTKPLLVLNAFVVRADSSPPAGDRRARPGYNVNRAGLGTEDPGVADRALGMSPAPQFEWEAFDAYWRKIHGPKILFPDGPEDRQTALLHYYLQQHRIPAGPCSEHAPPYVAPLDAKVVCRAARRPSARRLRARYSTGSRSLATAAVRIWKASSLPTAPSTARKSCRMKRCLSAVSVFMSRRNTWWCSVVIAAATPSSC